MKIRLASLVRAMTYGYACMLDLETGTPVSCAEKHLRKPRRYIRIPQIALVEVYQAYFKKLFRELPMIEDSYGLKSFPDYQDAVENHTYFDEYEYIKKAHNFSENILKLLFYENDRLNKPNFNPSFPSFDEYHYAYATQYAKDWCAQEGFEWYED